MKPIVPIAVSVVAVIVVSMPGAAAQGTGGSQSAIFMPSLSRGEVQYVSIPTAVLSPTPSSTPTPDAIGTFVAATLTAGAPTATESPTPSDTPDVVQTAIAGTMTALVPTSTPEPSLTPSPTNSPTITPTRTQTVRPSVTPRPTPTRTPTPQILCAQVLRDNSFENGDQWTSSGSGVRRITSDVLMQPFDGSWFLSIHPVTSESGLAVSSPIDLATLGNVVSVNLEYQVAGFTLDHISNSDGMIVAVDHPLGTAADPVVVESQANQDVVGKWVGRSFNIGPTLSSKGWQKFIVELFVDNDVSDNSWWYFDKVDVTVCSRYP